MDIIAQKRSLLSLWLESFVVINKCTGKLVKTFLCLIVFVLVMAVIIFLCMGSGALLNLAKSHTLPQTAGVGGVLLGIFFSLLQSFLGVFFLVVFYQIVADYVLQKKQPLMETFSSSIVPTIYQIISSILLGVPVLILGIVLAIISKGNPWVGLIALILLFLVMLRFAFAFIAIAVDHKGPIGGLVYSWQLTSGAKYVDVLLMILLLIGSIAVLYALMGGIGLIAYPFVLSSLAKMGAQATIIWVIIGLVLMVLCLFCYLAMMAFPVLVFLNRTAQEQPRQQLKKEDEVVFIPLPELDIPNTQNPSTGSAQSTQKQTGKEPTPATPNATDKSAGMDVLQVTKASIRTAEGDETDLSDHLNQVYTPREKHAIEHQEEDRMPTIVFDDELAKQLEHQFLEEKKQTPPNNEEPPAGDDSIPLSK